MECHGVFVYVIFNLFSVLASEAKKALSLYLHLSSLQLVTTIMSLDRMDMYLTDF